MSYMFPQMHERDAGAARENDMQYRCRDGARDAI